MNMKIISVILLQLLSFQSFAQDWVVPEERKGRLSPFKFDDNTRKEGERLYMINCKSCHGTPGKGDFQATLVPPPSDPATDKIQRKYRWRAFLQDKHRKGSDAFIPQFTGGK
jgi:hypothetical protein